MGARAVFPVNRGIGENGQFGGALASGFRPDRGATHEGDSGGEEEHRRHHLPEGGAVGMGGHGEELFAELIEADLEAADLRRVIDGRLLAFAGGEDPGRKHGEEGEDPAQRVPDRGGVGVGFHGVLGGLVWVLRS